MVDLIDTNGVKPALKKGVLGYDDYSVGGDAGRLYVGTGTASIAQAKKSEVDAKVPLVTSTDNAIVRFDGTTGKVQNSGVVIDDSNNVGVGVIPSAWSGCNPVQLGNSCGIYGFSNSNTLGVSANSTWNGTNDIYRYSSNAASKYSQSAGTHVWQIAPSGTAGNAITWTNAMTLDSAGNLRIGSSDAGINNTFITPSGEIQSVNNGIAYTKLKLNPSGGNVLIGTATDNGADMLQVNGSITFKGIGASDANTLTRSGYFSITTSDPGASNIPTYNVTIEVIATPSYGWITQKAIEILGQRLWIRTSNSGGATWTAWVEK